MFHQFVDCFDVLGRELAQDFLSADSFLLEEPRSRAY